MKVLIVLHREVHADQAQVNQRQPVNINHGLSNLDEILWVRWFVTFHVLHVKFDPFWGGPKVVVSC